MSAVNPLPTPSNAPGASEKRSYEPSMEEILASIRRIIADDQSLPKHPSIDPMASLAANDPTHQASPIPPAAEPTQFPEPVPFPEPHPLAPPPEAAHAPSDSFSPPPVPTPVPPVPEIAPFPSAQMAVPPEAPSGGRGAAESSAAPPFPLPDGPVGDEVAAATHSYGYEAAPPISEPDRELAPIAESLPAPEASPAPEPPPASEPPPAPEPLLPPEPQLSGQPIHDGIDEPIYDTPIEAPKPEPRSVPGSGPSLFSETTDSSVSSAFNLLAASRLADNSDELLNLAREMIRPLLRTWLDDNLPSMVERMVRAEIERVARGGR